MITAGYPIYMGCFILHALACVCILTPLACDLATTGEVCIPSPFLSTILPTLHFFNTHMLKRSKPTVLTKSQVMPITFGSVGDIITTGLLIKDLIKALHGSRGSASE